MASKNKAGSMASKKSKKAAPKRKKAVKMQKASGWKDFWNRYCAI